MSGHLHKKKKNAGPDQRITDQSLAILAQLKTAVSPRKGGHIIALIPLNLPFLYGCHDDVLSHRPRPERRGGPRPKHLVRQRHRGPDRPLVAFYSAFWIVSYHAVENLCFYLLFNFVEMY